MIKPRQKLGKYRIEKRLGEGGFSVVYQAADTIEGTRVALKILHENLLDVHVLEDFRREVRLAAKLEHPHVLSLKNADFINGHFVITYPLADRTLADRLQSRISLEKALDFIEQMLQAVAYAHSQRIIHCDIKPENLLIFPKDRLLLTDFGIAKVAMRTVRASGSGTVGYIAPEQAMGKPSYRSDVFSLGLIIYRMISGQLPEWPYEWPFPGYDRLRGRVHPDLISLSRRAIELAPNKRYHDAGHMLTEFQRIRKYALNTRLKKKMVHNNANGKLDWRKVLYKQFQKQYGQVLETRYQCRRCHGPVAESMKACPWCGTSRKIFREETSFPQQCPRCYRGMKLDWGYCPWCFGAGYEVEGMREYSDSRYTSRCTNRSCSRKLLMPFMCYCPWCRRKVKRKWPIPGSHEKCRCCGWGVLSDFWSHCPWCAKSISKSS